MQMDRASRPQPQDPGPSSQPHSFLEHFLIGPDPQIEEMVVFRVTIRVIFPLCAIKAEKPIGGSQRVPTVDSSGSPDGHPCKMCVWNAFASFCILRQGSLSEPLMLPPPGELLKRKAVCGGRSNPAI